MAEEDWENTSGLEVGDIVTSWEKGYFRIVEVCKPYQAYNNISYFPLKVIKVLHVDGIPLKKTGKIRNCNSHGVKLFTKERLKELETEFATKSNNLRTLLSKQEIEKEKKAKLPKPKPKTRFSEIE